LLKFDPQKLAQEYTEDNAQWDVFVFIIANLLFYASQMKRIEYSAKTLRYDKYPFDYTE